MTTTGPHRAVSCGRYCSPSSIFLFSLSLISSLRIGNCAFTRSFITYFPLPTKRTVNRGLHIITDPQVSASMRERSFPRNDGSRTPLHSFQMTSKESASISTVFENGLSFIGSSTSTIVSLGFFAALAYYRDALMVTFFLGAIGNAVLGKILKRILNQDRPTSDAPQPSDKGMPSSHAMSLGFIGTFTSLLLPPFGIPIICYVLISLYYRVRIKLHTTDQVLVGLGVGATNGAIWNSLSFGSFPLLPSIHFVEQFGTYWMPDDGKFPLTFLVIPALVGAVIVGSFERRIKGWLESKKE